MLTGVRERWRLRVPDVREARGDLVLLLWGDVPHWTVVDREFAAFLDRLDGTRSLDDLLCERPDWQPHARDLHAGVEALRTAGVMADGPRPRPPASPRIENVGLNLTLRCNLRCAFCYNLPHLATGAPREVTPAEVLDFLRGLAPLLGKTPTLTVLGGEPLLAADALLQVAEGARKLRFTTLVSTNGTRIADDFARRAAEAGLRVQVSLDGPTARLHDAGRGRGTFEAAVAGVRALVAAGVHTTISMVCHRGNLAALEAFLDLGRALGVTEARFIPLKRLGGAQGGGFQPVPLDALLRAALAVIRRRPELLPLLGSDALSVMAHTCRYSARRTSCGTGLQTVLLDADGSLYPCLNTNRPELRLGSIFDPSFSVRRLWETSPVLHEVRARTAIAAPDNPHVACPVRYFCLGGCRGENLALTGALDARPPHCADLRRAVLDMCWALAEHPHLVKGEGRTC